MVNVEKAELGRFFESYRDTHGLIGSLDVTEGFIRRNPSDPVAPLRGILQARDREEYLLPAVLEVVGILARRDFVSLEDARTTISAMRRIRDYGVYLRGLPDLASSETTAPAVIEFAQTMLNEKPDDDPYNPWLDLASLALQSVANKNTVIIPSELIDEFVEAVETNEPDENRKAQMLQLAQSIRMKMIRLADAG